MKQNEIKRTKFGKGRYFHFVFVFIYLFIDLV